MLKKIIQSIIVISFVVVVCCTNILNVFAMNTDDTIVWTSNTSASASVTSGTKQSYGSAKTDIYDMMNVGTITVPINCSCGSNSGSTYSVHLGSSVSAIDKNTGTTLATQSFNGGGTAILDISSIEYSKKRSVYITMSSSVDVFNAFASISAGTITYTTINIPVEIFTNLP